MRRDDRREDSERPDDATFVQGSGAELLVVDSQEILRGHQEVQIRHGKEFYRLRVTRTGKLLLNK